VTQTTSARGEVPRARRRGIFQYIAGWFFSGLLIVAPAALTIWALYAAFVWIDGLLDLEPRLGYRVPGLGFAVTLGLVTLIGFLASNFLTRFLIDLAEKIFTRLPLVRLIYTSIKDLLEAFVGEKKRFDQPVLVSLFPGSEARVLGFVTRREMDSLGLKDQIAVYLPQSYNFAGQLVVLPKERASTVEADSTSVMAFIVSGGVPGGETG
jgi:uncharacterized membrane protein